MALSKFNIRLLIEALQTNALDLSTPTDELNVSKRIAFTDGSGANQAHGYWHDQRTVAATTADNIDLAGALTSSFGATITAAEVKGIIVIHGTAAASAALQIGGHATAALATMFVTATDLDTDQPSLTLPPGGWFVLIAPNATGYVVTATDEDMLRVYNGAAAAVTYDIIVLYTTS